MLGCTLLIVDDYKPWRDTTAKFFRSTRKYTTYTASTCAEAVQLAEDLRPDFILLDYHLKDGTAAEVTARIRANETDKRTFILIVSGDETQRECAYSECQADHFILKDTLYQTIHEIMCGLKRRADWDRGIVEKGDIRLDPLGLQVFKDLKPAFSLSPERFQLLSILLTKSPDVVREEYIATRFYPHEIAEEKRNAIKILIHRLRQDLGPLACRIQNQRGVGWAYKQPDLVPP